MNRDLDTFSTGLPGLDRMLQGLVAGDNVVWQVDSVEDYLPFVAPFWAEARRQNRRPVYFRFARHRELIPPTPDAEVYHLRPEDGFEKFLGQIHGVIEQKGVGACYVFDWLSDLAADWYSDHMLGNFFRLTCPYLYDLKTIGYFALRKNHHAFEATDAIDRTAQVILKVHRLRDHLYLHPQKVFGRHSPTLYLLHRWEADALEPVTSSAVITETLAHLPQPWMDFSIHRPGVWLRAFRQAQATLSAVRVRRKSPDEARPFFERLLKMVATRDDRFVTLARRYFDLADLIGIMKRMIGTGLIGGKTLGMLLARAILEKNDPRWRELLERHDSFYIGSDVFYTYLVENGCWWARRPQADFEAYLERARDAQQRILEGTFPDSIRDQFAEMLAYFGQSPLIVRSSSLLEDNYGNAFSGKYESVFCANQGSPAERLEAFMNAVRTVYASTMCRESLSYRHHHGLLDRDEQMALLVQRVSGELHGQAHFPQVAGVGFSFNPFAWCPAIDPQAGVLRLVFGLGTRAVDRTGDDYTRLVALNEPLRRPEGAGPAVRQYAQRRVDVLDLVANRLIAVEFEAVAATLPSHLVELFTETDEPAWEASRANPARGSCPRALNFDRLFTTTRFIEDIRSLLQVLHRAYEYPVDIEFTANFLPDGQYRVNVVQCRPFQVKLKGEASRVQFPSNLSPDQRLLESHGPIVGRSVAGTIHRLIYVVPSVYSQLGMSQRYSVARTIGRLTHLPDTEPRRVVMLVGPGRWGTSMPALGIPVSFAEINTVSVICELALMHEGIIPDISLGTHFFNDLVEMDMLYLTVSPGQAGHVLNDDLIRSLPNRLADLLPQAAGLAEAIRVVDSTPDPQECGLFLNVDSMNQQALCYLLGNPPGFLTHPPSRSTDSVKE
jgi:pyruvate, water dikinase